MKYYAAKMLCWLALAMVGGCGSLYTRSYQALTIAEQIDAEAAKQFPDLDRTRRAKIVHFANSEAEGIAALAKWDATSDKLRLAIEGIPAAVKLARDAMVEIKAGTRPAAELSTWIASAIRLGLDFKALLDAAGVPLKLPFAIPGGL